MTPPTPTALYPRLLGASWLELPDAVRGLHSQGEIVHAAGKFQVRHGGWLARGLVRLAHMPAAGDNVDVRLTITPSERGEEWRRLFAGRSLVSWQGPRSAGGLVEYWGTMEIAFRLWVERGMLRYRSDRASLRLGPMRIPWPRWLAPRVTACERAIDERPQICVEVVLPVIGLLISYEGMVVRTEAP